MTYLIDDVLNDPLVTVEDRHDEMGSFAVRIGSLETIVSIELGRFWTSEHTKFSVSHSIHTPLQVAPYRSSHTFGDYWAYALHRALDSLLSYYRQAVTDGHMPCEAWLVKN